MGLIITIEDGGVAIENTGADTINSYPSGSTSLIYSNTKITSKSETASKLEISNVSEVDSIDDNRTDGAGSIAVPGTTKLLYDILKPFFFSELEQGGGGGGNGIPLDGTLPGGEGPAIGIKKITAINSTLHTIELFQPHGLSIGDDFNLNGVSTFTGHWIVTSVTSPLIIEANNDVEDINPTLGTFSATSSYPSSYAFNSVDNGTPITEPIKFKSQASTMTGFDRLSVIDRQTYVKRTIRNRPFDYTARFEDHVTMNGGVATKIVLVPEASPEHAGREIRITKIDSNFGAIRVQAFGSQKINGKAFIDLANQWDTLLIKVAYDDFVQASPGNDWIGIFSAGV